VEIKYNSEILDIDKLEDGHFGIKTSDGISYTKKCIVAT
jgi:thioredoxin reductase